MHSEQIYDKANALVKRADSRNPWHIAGHLGLNIYYNEDFKNLKGMYIIVCKRRCVFLSAKLSEQMAGLVLAHEIGHDMLHRAYAAAGPFRELALFDMTTRPEYEANAFAAHLLIDDDEVLELAREGYDVQQIASALGMNINLMLIKMNELNKLGYNYNTPYIPKGGFLKS